MDAQDRIAWQPFLTPRQTRIIHDALAGYESKDEAAGLDREAIIERRAGIMTDEFLGFVPQHVFQVRPDLAGVDEIDVDGETVAVPLFRGGSWYAIDNSEFLEAE